MHRNTSVNWWLTHCLVIGGGLDEAPFAYKDINEVMKGQTALVDVLGKFFAKDRTDGWSEA